MGDLAEDTALRGGNGKFVASLSPEWEIWGPNGGYVASIALRAAHCHSAFDRPASFSCHYLAVAQFGTVELAVRTLRRTKRAESLAVSMTQRDTPILEAIAWFVRTGDGLRHDHATMPEVASHTELEGRDLSQNAPLYPFWRNVETKPLQWFDDIRDRPVGEPVYRAWHRFVPRATFDDPTVDACRSLILLDTMGWPSATRAHPAEQGWMAPNLDVAVQFHRLDPRAEWLFVDTFSPVAEEGLIGFRSTVWTEAGRLMASGSGHLLCRPLVP